MVPLAQAYEACLYRVFLPDGGLDLRVGERSPLLDAWLEAQGAACWAILTAHNPRSRLLSPLLNQQRQAELEAALQAAGIPFLRGENRDPHEQWPIEASCLLSDCSRTDALYWARLFAQNAFLWGARGGAARLVWVFSAGESIVVPVFKTAV